MKWLWVGGNGPRELPELVHFHLVCILQINPDQLTGLKCLERMDFVNDVPVRLLRIFDPKAAAKTARVTDFASLDRHPELILYEGYIEKATGKVQLAIGKTGRRPPGDSA